VGKEITCVPLRRSWPGKETLVLVPEISLTPQLLSRFKDRFGNNLGLLHSGLGAGERYDQWRRVWRGDVKIAIGARSAIFAPFRKLGMIIVDEEHDSSYKQEEKLKYHARDLAVVRAKQADATLLLGSATPSLESFHNAKEGRFTLLRLPERMEGKLLPKVEVVDVKKGEGLLSERIREALQRNIQNKKQSLLFLNRRGFSNFILCPDCGLTFKCPNCSVTLTHHLRVRSLQCHYCDYRIPAPGDCPRCGSHRLRGVGIGTERLETEIRTLFPDVQVERMDSDTTAPKRAHQQILKRLESGQIDVLVGTQMIVKAMTSQISPLWESSLQIRPSISRIFDRVKERSSFSPKLPEGQDGEKRAERSSFKPLAQITTAS
jgi:primosomal protein N' (replication factor Y)